MIGTLGAGTLPLTHLLSYLTVLSRLRSEGRQRISFNDFAASMEELTPQGVRKELAALKVETVGFIDINRAYWAVERAQAAAKNTARQAESIHLALPGRNELLELLQASITGARPFIEGVEESKAAEAVMALDAAYDYAVETPDLFLLGHGRMAAGEVAFHHQIRTSKQFLEDMGNATLVADEVGLGKTIIAGLAIEEVCKRIHGHAVLILVPPNLRRQWHEKLGKFFGLSVATDRGPLSYEKLSREGILLLSLDKSKGKRKDTAVREILLGRKWDLLIVDEAHQCRNESSIRHKFVFSLRAARRLFLTATPVQNSGYDIFSLANLLLPGFFGQKVVFTERHMATERTLKNSQAIQDQLTSLMLRTLRRDTGGLPFAIREDPRAVRVTDFKQEEKAIYDRLLTILKGIYNRHLGSSAAVQFPSGRESHVSQFVLIAMLVLREMASHPLAAVGTLKSALRDKVLEMARLSRDDSDLNDLDEFIKKYDKQKWDVRHHAKSERLVQLAGELIAAGRTCVIYVNYHITHDIVSKLISKASPKVLILGYHGKLCQDQKDRVLERFRNERGAFLISTDCGAEGLDMEFADTVINYDFPWNPMRLEQRIGRVDRYGQPPAKTISVYNFLTEGTVEEYVQIVLTRKIKECQIVLGEFTSPLEIEKVYEDKMVMGIGNALMNSRDADDMRAKMNALKADDWRGYVGDYGLYEKRTPQRWTWSPRG